MARIACLMPAAAEAGGWTASHQEPKRSSLIDPYRYGYSTTRFPIAAPLRVSRLVPYGRHSYNLRKV
jgi:hypothetical protein